MDYLVDGSRTKKFNSFLYSTPDTVWFQNLPNTERDTFLAALLAAESATRNAVEPVTSSKQAFARNRYNKYLHHSISITSDLYLDNFSKLQRIKILEILGAFAQALQEGRFHPKSN
jgi:hypothetical protein